MRVHRRSFLQHASLLAGGAAMGLSLLPTARGAEFTKSASGSSGWPLMRGDAIATGVARTPLPDKLQVLWKHSVDGGAYDITPAVVEGVVYIGDLDGRVFALNLADGKEKWAKKFETGFNASPSVKDGHVYLGDQDGLFYCLDAKTGEPKWKHTTEAEINSCAGFWNEFVVVGSQDGNLYCLHAKSGEEKWKMTTGDQIRCSPTIAGNRSFVAGCDQNFHIVDLEKGEDAASVPIGSPTGSTPGVLGDLVYFGVHGDAFLCVDWKAAKEVWRVEELNTSTSYRNSPVVTKSLVVNARHKMVYAYEPATGKEVWTFTAKNRVDSSPIAAGDKLYFGSADGRVYCLGLKDGKEISQLQLSGSFNAGPAAVDGKLLLASDRGTVYCLGAKG